MPEFKFIDHFKEAIQKLDITSSDIQLDQVHQHFNLLKKYNRIVNLTALTDPREIAFRLFADSLLPLKFINSQGINHILDIGPGGGFPSIPLRLFCDQNISFTLVESRERVVFYLEDIISTCQLKNINVGHSRIQDFILDTEYDLNFDMVLNKAAFQINEFLDLATQVLKPDGIALHWISKLDTGQQVIHNWNVLDIISPISEDPRFPGSVILYKKQ